MPNIERLQVLCDYSLVWINEHGNLYDILIYYRALAMDNSKGTHADVLEIEVNVSVDIGGFVFCLRGSLLSFYLFLFFIFTL